MFFLVKSHGLAQHVLSGIDARFERLASRVVNVEAAFSHSLVFLFGGFAQKIEGD